MEHRTDILPESPIPVWAGGGPRYRRYLGGGSIQGGMTQAEYMQLMSKQQADYEALIGKQNQAMLDAEAQRAKQDAALAQQEQQRLAANEATIIAAQKLAADELTQQDKVAKAKEKLGIQSSFDSLFKSLISGTQV